MISLFVKSQSHFLVTVIARIAPDIVMEIPDIVIGTSCVLATTVLWKVIFLVTKLVGIKIRSSNLILILTSSLRCQ